MLKREPSESLSSILQSTPTFSLMSSSSITIAWLTFRVDSIQTSNCHLSSTVPSSLPSPHNRHIHQDHHHGYCIMSVYFAKHYSRIGLLRCQMYTSVQHSTYLLVAQYCKDKCIYGQECLSKKLGEAVMGIGDT